MPRHGKPIYETKVNDRTRWVVRASIRERGRRKQIVRTFDTYVEAENFLAHLQVGDVIARVRDDFDAWAELWLGRKEAAGVRPNTLAGYRSDLTHPRDAFGWSPIQEVTESMVEQLVVSMVGAGKSKRTVGKMLGTLRSVFQLAIKRGIVKGNPALDVEPQGRPARPRDALTAAELAAIREAIAGDPWEACWMLTLAGLRRSELLALRWSDFNSKTGELSIVKGRGIIGGVQAPKTARGARVLPLDDERVVLLRSLFTSQVEMYGRTAVQDGYICVNEFGRPMRPEDWSDRWRAWCVSTKGVRNDHTLHAARHSTVTFMRNAGVPDHIVAAWHGHDEVVMRQTYSHAHTEQLKTASVSLTFSPGK